MPANNPVPSKVSWQLARDEIKEGVKEATGVDVSACKFDEIYNRVELADSTQKFIVRDSGRQALFVLKVSSDIDTTAVAQSTVQATIFGDAIGEKSARRILLPVHDGKIDGRSFGLYHHLEPLAAKNPAWLLQRVRLMPHVVNWLETVTVDTNRPATEEEMQRLFIKPLQSVVEDPSELGPDYQRLAERALERINSSSWQPRVTAMHGDIWKNNILIDRRNKTSFPDGSAMARFMFIDWSTARLDGYPFFDLIRTGNTFRSNMQQHLKKHCEIVECAREDIPGYIVAALADIRFNLHYCPRHVLALSAQKFLADLNGYDLA